MSEVLNILDFQFKSLPELTALSPTLKQHVPFFYIGSRFNMTSLVIQTDWKVCNTGNILHY
jgi:hypothetical protein